jgi:very-short-patch-repair endonuclease
MHAIDPILEIGERHHGLVLAVEARTAGLTRAALRHRVKTGQLQSVGARVLRVAGAPRSDLQAVLAAVLDASPGAFASGHTAAALWAVPGYRLSPVHVVRPRGVSGRRTGVADVLHTIAGLRPAHVTVLDQVPVLRPEVVVLQLCASEHAARAERALDNLWRRRLLSGPSVRRALNELAIQGRGGVRLLRELLDRRGDDYVPAASNLERRFEAVLERAGEPSMRRQVDSGGDHWVGRVDFRDADLPLIVEVQSEHFHSALVDRQHDARRLAALSEAGFVVVEVSEEQVWHRPAEVVEAVRTARRRLSPTSRARTGRSNDHSGRENASAAAVTLPAWTRQARSSHAMPITPRPV